MAIGETLYSEDSVPLIIAGVIPDYHHEGMMMEIEPLVLRQIPAMFNYVQVRITPGKEKSARNYVDPIYNAMHPGRLIHVRYMSDYIREFYDLLFGDLIKILLAFSIIACLVSCLGLLGIVMYTTKIKIREICIRKVLGASNSELITYLSRGFIKLVLISIVIAIPAAYAINSLWLQHMATRIPLDPWYFISGAVGLIVLSLITIGSQTLRALKIDPAENLKNE